MTDANDQQQTEAPSSAEIEATEIMAEFWIWAKKHQVADVHPDHAPTLIQAFRAGWLSSAAQVRSGQALNELKAVLR